MKKLLIFGMLLFLLPLISAQGGAGGGMAMGGGGGGSLKQICEDYNEEMQEAIYSYKVAKAEFREAENEYQQKSATLIMIIAMIFLGMTVYGLIQVGIDIERKKHEKSKKGRNK